MRVLIAEDEVVSRMILEGALEGLGHECLVAPDGGRAWEILRDDHRVDVVISDWMMPVVDGLELCRRIREGERGNERDGYTYFVFLTALGDRDHLLTGLESGADDYLSKPLDPEELQVRMIAAQRVTSLHRRLSEQKAALFEHARKDPLTGLRNRFGLHEDLEALQARAERYGHSFSAVLCDIDFFKAYNDRHGHPAGDEVLKKVANAISGDLRTGDIAYRYGGEEFLIILPEQSLESATVAAERLRRSVEDLRITHEAKTPPGIVTISMGLAALPFGEEKSIEDVLKEADAALYGAKEAGRNRVMIPRAS